MKYIDNEITFNGIEHAGLITGGPKLSKGKYESDNNGNIMYNMPIINAIDIDWNNAEIPGVNNPLTSTGQLLAIIGELKQSLGNINTKIDDFEHQQIPSNIEEQLQALNNRIDEYHLDYSFEYDLLNVVKSSGPSTMKKTDTVNFVFSAVNGYILPDSINVDGATYSYNNGTVTISNPTKRIISIYIHTDELRQCTFNIPSLNYIFCELISNKSTFVLNDTFDIQLTLTGDEELYALPNSISGTNCSVVSYNASTGKATLKCSGTGNMSISASVKDIAIYYFAVALEANPIFTISNNTIIGCDLNNITNISGYTSAQGSCPIDFVNGFTVHSSVDVEGAYVWFIIPSKYFNKSNFNFINGNNKYLLKQSNIQDLTVNTKIKECVDIDGKIPYTLVCVSNNGLGGKQEFKKI